ncbi:aprataxin and PNK-like factor isoform X1 [Pararge aegeria]|uniref:aprataxin and PNK-like factor isoform X1 n=1 Tax=Pararge aegeria TaxID=116150 RepID=UPI0019D29452|nr:aprataxin and PNK-like factor isoform X1 [Pararge aegeria]
MPIKLIRTDAEDPCKILLPLGNHVIGRGKLLDCDDKKISRQHGELQVTDDSLSLKALHQNPCFYLRKGLNPQILLQDKTIPLFNGDRFGLLPDTFWYEVLFCSGMEAPTNIESEKNTEEYCLENNECKDKTSSNEFDCNKTQSAVATQNSVPTEVLTKNSEPANSMEDGTGQKEPVSVKSESKPSKEEEQLSIDTNSVKRSHSPDNSDVKKIKLVEDEAANSDDVKPGPSLNQGQAAQPMNNVGANGASNNNPPRERCMYGGDCYRRNPQHLAQFSHPRDADWGPGERGQCPYGAQCAKTDPRHWRDHEHPPGKLPPPRPGQKKRRQRRDSAESLTQSVIVTGKRARKTVQVPGHWSGDESDEPDPYATDESDDWEPGSAPSQDFSEDFL